MTEIVNVMETVVPADDTHPRRSVHTRYDPDEWRQLRPGDVIVLQVVTVIELQEVQVEPRGG